MSKRFPIQGGLTVSWDAAEKAYRGYTRLYSDAQSLERIAERGGFGLGEFVSLVMAGRTLSMQKAREVVRSRPDDRTMAPDTGSGPRALCQGCVTYEQVPEP